MHNKLHPHDEPAVVAVMGVSRPVLQHSAVASLLKRDVRPALTAPNAARDVARLYSAYALCIKSSTELILNGGDGRRASITEGAGRRRIVRQWILILSFPIVSDMPGCKSYYAS